MRRWSKVGAFESRRSGHRECRLPVRAPSLALPLAFFVAVHCGCLVDAPPANVVLISVDTLRPDHLSGSGHRNPTSPNIDDLAAASVVFENAYSVSGWTLPSMATIMTGRYPRDHGATDFHWAMDPRLPTMATLLRDVGYDTRGYVSHVILQPEYGVAQGFQLYDATVLDVGDPHAVATATLLTDRVIEDLGDIEEPFFVWVHYFDPHFAYLPHSPWSQFGVADIHHYDQEIAHTDSQIARLMEALKMVGLYEETAIIFTSDHGEEFGEHDGEYHYTLHEEVIRVPLTIKVPGGGAGVESSRVEQIDLLPTVIALLGYDLEFDLPGRDVLDPASTSGPVFFERDRPPPFNQRGVIDGSHKLIVIESADIESIPPRSRGTYVPITNVHPGIFLYDLEEDPGEVRNLYREDDPRARELLVMLAQQAAGEAAPLRPVGVDESLREQLRTLGYIQ